MFLRQCMHCQSPLCFFFALASNFNTLRPRMVPSARLASARSASTVLAPMISEATSGTYQKDSPPADESIAIRNGQPNHMKGPLVCSCPSQDQKKNYSHALSAGFAQSVTGPRHVPIELQKPHFMIYGLLCVFNSPELPSNSPPLPLSPTPAPTRKGTSLS